jgi:hypothetical protein
VQNSSSSRSKTSMCMQHENQHMHVARHPWLHSTALTMEFMELASLNSLPPRPNHTSSRMLSTCAADCLVPLLGRGSSADRSSTGGCAAGTTGQQGPGPGWCAGRCDQTAGGAAVAGSTGVAVSDLVGMREQRSLWDGRSMQPGVSACVHMCSC